ncbi:hypothetical protein DOTSEDRAFT_72754 [Dothistroma septosporum NZE10]|uniref:Putative gamma-glutamylcyclotransferase n=1 Tax=Dothistroma septosporum (strain NZE10 / CBS 128990) TaxID=675120 RepID=M2Y5G4_DOTSN|nr:hypothetical protein DOTSEDRAFT_72754 [Dothistroma septosporum NZE10]
MSANNPVYTTHKLKTCPAILHSHQRRKVKNADYPGLITQSNSSVWGTYVTGLTANDIWRLDIFEGDEYERRKVKVRLLEESGEKEGEEVEAETYVWISGEDRLEDSEWDFEEFRRDKMRFWVGREGEGEYAEVDEAVEAAEKEDRKDGTGGRGAGGGAITTALHEATRSTV